MTERKQPLVLKANAKQRQALTSPMRLEILGQFTSPGGMSIREVAQRMGRSPGSLYYHFRIMEEVGVLKRVGKRSTAKKAEALFLPVAHRFEFGTEDRSDSAIRGALKAMESAFRMALRDLEAAMRGGTARTSGAHRTFFAARVHFRTNKKTLAEINRHLKAIEKILLRESQRTKLPPDADQYCSLTLALLPLRDREQG